MKKQYVTLELQLYLYNDEDIVRTSTIFIDDDVVVDGSKLFGGDGWSED